MLTGIFIRRRLVTLFIVVLAIALAAVSPAIAAQATGPTVQSDAPVPADAQPAVVAAQDTSNPYFSVETVTLGDGSRLERMIINSPPRPPQGYELERPAAPMLAGDVLLPVPAYSWVFGCSAVSASMVAAYWDRNGLPNIYTGPTNGGVMPMENSTATTGWPTWTDSNGGAYPGNPLTASRNGLDGRTTRGSIDDYWVYYNSNVTSSPDPYITNSWTQHAWGEAVGDYMWTSQSTQGNTDGATSFWGYSDATKLPCASLETGYNDGTVGRKHFYQARGYTVPAAECYNQKTDNQVSGGFSFAQYKAKIDAGYPVFLNLVGHSIVGVGYNATTSPPTVYLNDTWSWTSGTAHSMPWGGSYEGMALVSVSIADPVLPTTTPAISINDVSVTEGNSGTTNANFAVNLSAASSSTVTVSWATTPGTATADTDYVTASGSVTFAPNVTSQMVTVQVQGDTAFESNETFNVNLANPVGATIGKGTGVGTIVNDDTNIPPVAVISATPTSGYAPLAVSFSGSGSSDSDGSIVSYSWNFGDGTSGTGATVAHTYASTGAYTALLTVTDDRGGKGTATTAITASQNPARVIRVGDIVLSVVTSGKNKAGKAVIKVTNLTGGPVANATVNAQWSGLVTGTASGKTDATGQVTFTSKSTNKRGTITIKVTGMTPPAGYVYDPTKNVKTSASVTF